MNSQSGKHFKCFVRPNQLGNRSLTNRTSRRDALLVTPQSINVPLFILFIQGFLPVIYTWFTTRRNSLPLQPEDQTHVDNKSFEHLAGWKVLLLWIPALCDLTGTTVSHQLPLHTFSHHVSQLMNVGLLYTPVSIYQMTRGALVLFVGVLSVIFLRRHLWLYQLVISSSAFH
jgi:drug/metabolite transporter (DMT)-like permease